MSFRVIHHQGDKDLLIEKVKVIAAQLKHEYRDDFDDESEWEQAVDLVVGGDFSDTRRVFSVFSRAINHIFPPISEDDEISAYLDLANKTTGKLAKTLQMFVNGRNFSTGNAEGPYYEETCGYLTSDEVREFLELIKAYDVHNAESDEKDFVDSLIDTFSALAEKNSGDLFIGS